MIIFVLILCFTNSGIATEKENKVVAAFDRGMSKQDFEEEIKRLQQNGVQIEYLKTTFTFGGLLSLEISINSHDGFSGSLIRKPLLSKKTIYIIRDFDSDSKMPICLGECEITD